MVIRELSCVVILAASLFLWAALAGPAAAADFPKAAFSLKGPDGGTWTITGRRV
jgi:hypothetical protein